MSAFSRLLHPLPAARRSYSSFFSKPGGGRYFNSHKPGKPVVTATTKDPSTSASASAPAQVDPPTAPSTPPPSAIHTVDEASSPSSSTTTASVASPRSSTLIPLAMGHPHGLPAHPVVAAKDLQLLQFFALHRPLLLLPDPPAVFRSPPPSTPLFQPPRPQETTWGTAPVEDGADEAAAALPGDADAEAARQLTRALTMTRAGATVAWDDTLRRLGLDVDLAARDLQAAEWDQEWEDILADSVKRKRRKKMKKHKLRKRRKLTRASRLKLR